MKRSLLSVVIFLGSASFAVAQHAASKTSKPSQVSVPTAVAAEQTPVQLKEADKKRRADASKHPTADAVPVFDRQKQKN